LILTFQRSCVAGTGNQRQTQMDSKISRSISNIIYRDYPEFKGITPKIQAQGDKFLLVFQSSSKTEDGYPITRTLRVVAAADGRIIKKTTSR